MRVALDSNIFVYALDPQSAWNLPAVTIFKQLEAGTMTGVASVLALSEVLTYPFMKSQVLGEGAQLFMEGLLGLDYISTDAEVAIRAARLRAQHGRKLDTPDAIHLATAEIAGAEYFVTNDHALQRLAPAGLKIHLLGEALR